MAERAGDPQGRPSKLLPVDPSPTNSHPMDPAWEHLRRAGGGWGRPGRPPPSSAVSTPPLWLRSVWRFLADVLQNVLLTQTHWLLPTLAAHSVTTLGSQ